MVSPSLLHLSEKIANQGEAGPSQVVVADGSRYDVARVGFMSLIFFVSLFSVSFPGVSKRTKYIRIPHIVFFIGKHFGTGVILSTAFCHLLQDAFESLQHASIKKFYHGIGKWTGAIILGSLLFIFLIEYISTSYVEHLHADPSAPSTPAPSRSPSPTHPVPVIQIPVIPESELERNGAATEYTPLLPPAPPRITSSPHALTLIQLPTPHYLNIVNSPRIKRSGSQIVACPSVLGGGRGKTQDRGRDGHRRSAENERASEAQTETRAPRIGRRRQVVAILVLQLGIMIHSLVIGLTLSLTSGSDFATLITAIIFHQLFEGLSLGIRIAALPPPRSSSLEGENLKSVGWLKPTLSFLFAVTTPLGMGIGMAAFKHGSGGRSDRNAAKLILVQGVMSAASAGMLIYAATVEMIAGDFVFGGIETDGHEGHGHSRPPPSEQLRDEEEGRSKKGDVRKKAVAVVSLLAGVMAMGAIE
ncbi:Zinc/iron permease [Infundibulicybe gibba]|nr:Zinc/iron permease [Infundibulicybe gibba]